MFKELFKNKKPIIGMIHLPPLPGYPKHPGMKEVIKKALIDLKTLEKAGFDGVLVENDNDQPHQIGVSKTIINAFSNVMGHILKKAKIPVGMEIIYDMEATIKVAHKVGAQFVRLDVFVDNVETRWGKISAPVKKITSLIKKLNAQDLVLLTDIQVKHAKMLDKKSLKKSTQEAIKYKTDGLLVTGDWTGHPPTIQDCLIVKKTSQDIPVLVGSGVDNSNISELFKYVDGAIIGTSIKTGDYIDFEKAKKLVSSVTKIRNGYINIVSVGDIGFDHYINLNLKKPGGISFNFAANLSNLGSNCSLVSVIGKDLIGKKLKSLLHNLNIDISQLTEIKGKSPKQKIILSKNGERKFIGYNSGILAKWKLNKKDLDFILKHDAVFVPLSDGMEHIFQMVANLKGDVIKVTDFSQDYIFADFDKRNNVIEKYCKYFDINFVGATEKQIPLITKLSKKYSKKVFVLTLGEKGSIGFLNGKKFTQSANAVKIVDTTGCGDAFQAGFLVTYLKTNSIQKSLKKATEQAASVITHIGSTQYKL